jgi:acetylornithine deacetylase/succinyl-diaminopimelate desuccinylase-like protein
MPRCRSPIPPPIAIKDPDAYARLLKDQLKSAMLRNTVSLTVMKAGCKTNVIPAEAECQLDCRLLPGVNKDDFIAQIKKVIDDPSIEICVLEWEHTDASPHNSELFDVIKSVAAQADPGVPVVPLVVPWFTDSHWFRQFGTICYGFEPIPIDAVHLGTMHAKDERVPEKGFAACVRLTCQILARICGVEK